MRRRMSGRTQLLTILGRYNIGDEEEEGEAKGKTVEAAICHQWYGPKIYFIIPQLPCWLLNVLWRRVWLLTHSFAVCPIPSRNVGDRHGKHELVKFLIRRIWRHEEVAHVPSWRGKEGMDGWEPLVNWKICRAKSLAEERRNRLNRSNDGAADRTRESLLVHNNLILIQGKL